MQRFAGLLIGLGALLTVAGEETRVVMDLDTVSFDSVVTENVRVFGKFCKGLIFLCSDPTG